ncbi:MAG: family 20 glycosylhydrolase [Clostridia bacterium]|nr:family 20 glycosylhydrolase [Clostridia bacterium]
MIILPIPKECEYKEGVYILPDKTGAACDSKRVLNYLSEFMRIEGDNEGISFEINSELENEEYTLEITENAVYISGGDEEALFRASQTLKQIVLQAEDRKIPCVKISDKPDFKKRGIMLDVSRGRIQKPETIKLLIDIMADMKYNELQLYFDNVVFEYKSMSKYYKNGEVLTVEDIKELQKYCSERFIELVPNQNSLGHMQGWIEKEEFRPLGITRDDGKISCTVNPLLPESIELVDRLYGDLLPLFSSDKVNIGMDEPFELGQGETREVCEKEGVGRLYTDYLKKVCSLAKEKYQKRPMFWDDIIMKHPEYIDELPPDAIVVDWGYEADTVFEKRCRRIKEAGLDYYVAPGTSNWGSVTGRGKNMLYNIMAAADSGARWGAMGFLLTDWCDDGGVMPLFMSYLSYAIGAAYSWNSNCNMNVIESGEAELVRISYRRKVLSTARNYADKFIFKTEGNSFSHVLHKLGKAYLLEQSGVFNMTQLSRLPRFEIDDSELGGIKPEYFAEMQEYIEKRKAEGLKSTLYCEDGALIKEEFELICDIAIFLTKALQISAGEYNDAVYCAQLPPLEPIKERFELLWRKRNLDCGYDKYESRISGVLKKTEKLKNAKKGEGLC